MEQEQKRTLRNQYDERKPDKGIVCWQSGQRMWIAISKDAASDYNRSSFQLKLGSWPNRELQSAYNADPDSFQWSLLKKLEYEDRDDDVSEELELLYEICMEEYPQAKKMRPGKK